jgi:hypothetical protein
MRKLADSKGSRIEDEPHVRAARRYSNSTHQAALGIEPA